MLGRKRSGQSTAEYAIVIGLVIAAAVGMQIYVKRGIQAKVKSAVDWRPADPGNRFVTNQFEPDYSSSNMTTRRDVTESVETKDLGEVVRSIKDGGGEKTSRWGSQTTAASPN